MRRRTALTAAIMALGVWLGSLCEFVQYYGTVAAWRMGDGWAGTYWRGDPELRKSYLYNGGEWPLHEDNHFAGSEPPEGKWEVYEPGITLWWQWREAMQDGLVITLGRLGFAWPDVRITKDAACVVVPLGPIGTGGAFFLAWRVVKPRRKASLHCCRVCGYDLRASKDRCPECGNKIVSDAGRAA